MNFPISIFRVLLLVAALIASVDTCRAGGGRPTLIGWNNLGMHCMDDDYSVFSILPPFNTVDAQLINSQGKLVTLGTGITVTYEAVADPDGSINRTGVGKSNFWEFAHVAFGATLAPEFGLAGTRMSGPANTPQPLTFNAAFNWFEVLGFPVTPVDDAGRYNPYPMLRLVARDAAGTKLAETKVVTPVSSEMDCRACHASNAGPAARPLAGWQNDPNGKRDFRLNILRLHDEKNLANPDYQAALAANGWPAAGLHHAVTQTGAVILCAKCHASEALGTGGAPGTSPLTRAMHAKHADVVNPANGLPLDHSSNRAACYTCHPGSATRCLRGAMGSAVAPDGTMAMQCQSCHGTMSQVGALNRTGWLDEPNCQNCHTGTATQNSGQIRYTSVFDVNGQPRVPANPLFATNPNTPAPGKSLYRFSKGHGGLQCSACHGSTHAEYPAAHRNDNIQSIALQGHSGVLADCTACHATMPTAVNAGPHGMHPIGTAWINTHKTNGKSADCLGCHGADRRGTVLSRAFADKTLTFTKDGASYSIPLFRGATVSCFLCHKREDNGAPGGVFTNNHRPVVTNTKLTTAMNVIGAVTLNSSDADGNARKLRIISQPHHGTVTLSGSVATYFLEAGFTGPDLFTFAAFDGFADSNLGTVSVTVGESAPLAARDSDGDGLPDLVEYALGLAADFPSVNPGPYLSESDGQQFLTLSLPRSAAPSDASVLIEVSGDLINWVPATIITNTITEVAARDSVPVGGTPRFIRIKASRQ